MLIYVRYQLKSSFLSSLNCPVIWKGLALFFPRWENQTPRGYVIYQELHNWWETLFGHEQLSNSRICALVIRLYCFSYKYFNVVSIYKITIFSHLAEADLFQKPLIPVLWWQNILVSACFLKESFLIPIYFSSSFLILWAGPPLSWLSAWYWKLSQVTDCSWDLQNPGDVNFTHRNLF